MNPGGRHTPSFTDSIVISNHLCFLAGLLEKKEQRIPETGLCLLAEEAHHFSAAGRSSGFDDRCQDMNEPTDPESLL